MYVYYILLLYIYYHIKLYACYYLLLQRLSFHSLLCLRLRLAFAFALTLLCFNFVTRHSTLVLGSWFLVQLVAFPYQYLILMTSINFYFIGYWLLTFLQLLVACRSNVFTIVLLFSGKLTVTLDLY